MYDEKLYELLQQVPKWSVRNIIETFLNTLEKYSCSDSNYTIEELKDFLYDEFEEEMIEAKQG